MKVNYGDPKPLKKGTYRTDLFNRQPIFLVKHCNNYGNVSNCFVTSWEEAFSLIGPLSVMNVNPSYLAALIMGRRDSNISPYLKINRLKRSNILRIKSESYYELCNYNSLKNNLKYKSAEHFYDSIRKNISEIILNSIKNKCSEIAIEHSSGIDSNTILSSVLLDAEISKDRVFTWSNEGDGEKYLINKFRKKFKLKKNNCLNYEKYKDYAKERLIPSFSDFELKRKVIEILGYSPQIGGDIQSLIILQQKGSGLLFSGHGGDQSFSHHGKNVGSDLTFNLNFFQLYKWLSDKKDFIRFPTSRLYYSCFRGMVRDKISRKINFKNRNNLLIKYLTDYGYKLFRPYLKIQNYPWELDFHAKMNKSIRERVSADWVSVRLEDEQRLSNAFGISKCFPFLNEKAISMLLNQNPLFFCERQNSGRLALLNAFKDILPEELVLSPKKSRPLDMDWEEKSKNWVKFQINEIFERNKNWNPYLIKIWQIESLKSKSQEILKNYKSFDELYSLFLNINTLDSINVWFDMLDDY